MKDEDEGSFYYGERLEGGIYTAVEAWSVDRDAVKAQYGPIASWNTSEVTNMYRLFCNKAGFNGDLSCWDVSNVTSLAFTFCRASSFSSDLSRWNVSKVNSMSCMFSDATSFDQQLGDAWARSTARKTVMFIGSPGSIMGKTRGVNGTPE